VAITENIVVISTCNQLVVVTDNAVVITGHFIDVAKYAIATTGHGVTGAVDATIIIAADVILSPVNIISRAGNDVVCTDNHVIVAICWVARAIYLVAGTHHSIAIGAIGQGIGCATDQIVTAVDNRVFVTSDSVTSGISIDSTDLIAESADGVFLCGVTVPGTDHIIIAVNLVIVESTLTRCRQGIVHTTHTVIGDIGVGVKKEVAVSVNIFTRGIGIPCHSIGSYSITRPAGAVVGLSRVAPNGRRTLNIEIAIDDIVIVGSRVAISGKRGYLVAATGHIII